MLTMLIKKVRYLLSLLTVLAPFYSSATTASASEEIYTIIGANGQTGSIVARSLLAQRKSVRVVLHKPEQAESWQTLGADVRIADVGDKAALREAFSGSHKAYLLNPPVFDYGDPLARFTQVNIAMVEAADEAEVQHVVALSCIGAHLDRGTGGVLYAYDLEQKLKGYRGKSTIVRVPGFMENWNRSLESVFKDSVLPTMHVPANRPMPMVSVKDIGDIVADCLIREPGSNSIIELYGPREYSPDDVAGALSSILKKPINAFAIPRENWETILLTSMNSKLTALMCEMYDGMNTEYIAFEGRECEMRRGTVSLEEALSKGVEAYLKNTQRAFGDK